MYCLVNCDLMEGFLERRISYLENYRKLIYWSESDFVGPQIVGVFEDGLHFDLYTVTLESLRHMDEILILHDPKGLLLEYKAEMFSMMDELPLGVQKLVEIAAELIESLNERLDEGWNQPFFDFMVQRIQALT